MDPVQTQNDRKDTNPLIATLTSRHISPLMIGILYVCLLIAVTLISFRIFWGGKQKNQGTSDMSQSVTVLSPTNIPTPTPLQGPGPYACDPIGICSHYKDAKGAGCPKTYADSHCLDECGDKKVQCPK
jgi:hypothetical protein